MKVAVIFGGRSVEHEISIISALQAIENFPEKYEVIPVYLSKDFQFYMSEDFKNIEIFKDLSNLKNKYQISDLYNEQGRVYIKKRKTKLFKKNQETEIDIFFPIVHGTNVEDGKLQGYLEQFQIPVVGPSVLSAAIGQDKAITREILSNNGINQTKYITIYDNKKINEHIEYLTNELDLPYIIKPANLGSSVGIEIVKNKKDLFTSIEEAFKYDTKIIVEELLEDFEEMNISVLGNYRKYELSSIEKVFKQEDILSFHDKYQSSSKTKGASSTGMAQLSREIPANINSELQTEIEKIALKTAMAIDSTGVIRIDLLVTKSDIFVNEVNNIPGSLAFYLWEEKSMPYKELLEKLIEIAIDDSFTKKTKETSFKSNVLNQNAHGIKS